MRKITTKKATSKRKKEVTPVEVNTPVNYINIREVSPELQQKKNLLWLGVGAFAIILIVCWFLVLRANVASNTNALTFSQLSQQINDSLAKFDTQLKDRAAPTAINIDDLNSIKDEVAAQIKSNPDSSLWPTHEFTKIGLSLQYPDAWQKLIDSKYLLVSDSTSTTIASYGQLTITLKDNSKGLPLASWLQKNIDLTAYQPQKSIFIFSTSTPENLSYLKIDATLTTTSTLNRLYYINSTSSKKVIEIKSEARGDEAYYQPLMEEIIATIKLIK